VRSPDRWPLHPAPIDGEALSSWLLRIASGYEMTVGQLIDHGLGHDPKIERDLDRDPPPALLDTLAQRTGSTTDRVRQMCLAGWTPWLLDSLQAHPAGFDTYVREFSVLLKPGKRSKHRPGTWVGWIPRDRVQRACPGCMEDPGRQGLLLIWRLPLSLSCPEHGLMLEPCFGFPGEYFFWASGGSGPSSACDAVLAMDRRTEQALTVGQVELPGRSVHAGVWFRLLRTLLDELSTPVTYWGSRGADLSLIWDSSGHPVRAGQAIWRPYEAFPWPIQAQLLEAVAHAIRLLEDGAVGGRGTHARLFFPVHEPVDDGHAPTAPANPAYARRWDQARASLQDAIRLAREDPTEAQALYNFFAARCRDPQSIERLLGTFGELGIPTASAVTQA
jgi:hypothetical protein